MLQDICAALSPGLPASNHQQHASRYAAAALAYGDVSRAFDEFLRVNAKGPFILASHSQGSIHALREERRYRVCDYLEQRSPRAR